MSCFDFFFSHNVWSQIVNLIQYLTFHFVQSSQSDQITIKPNRTVAMQWIFDDIRSEVYSRIEEYQTKQTE